MKGIRLWVLVGVCVPLALLGCSGVQTYPVPTEVRSGVVGCQSAVYRYTVYEDYPGAFIVELRPSLEDADCDYSEFVRKVSKGEHSSYHRVSHYPNSTRLWYGKNYYPNYPD